MGPLVEATFRIALAERPQVLSVSEGVKGLLGYAQEDFLSGRVSLAELVHAHDAKFFARLFCPQCPTDCETFNIRFRQANGRIRCVRGNCSLAIAANGNSILNLTLQDAKGLRSKRTDLNSSVTLRSVLESVDECVYFKDRNHVITSANRNYCQRLSNAEGLPRDLVGLTDYDLFPDEFADRSYELEQEIFAGSACAHEVQESIGKDGERTWIDTRKFPVKDHDGEIVGIFGICTDITEGVLVERARTESEESLREAQRIAGLGTYVLEFATGTWTSSDVLDEIFGIGEDFERTVEGWRALIHPDDRAEMKAHLENEVLGRGIPFSKEYRIVRRSDGAVRWMLGIGKLEIDPHGKPRLLRGTIQDITERKLVETALRASEASLRESQQIAGLGSFTLNLSTLIWTASDVLYELLGIDKSYEHTVDRWTDLIHCDDLPGLAAEFEVTRAEKGRLFDKECRFIRQTDRTVRWAHVLGRLELESPGKPRTMRGTLQDITDRKMAEAALQESSGLLQLFIQDAPTGLAMFDREMRYISASRRWIEDYGLKEWEIVGRCHYDIFPKIPERWRAEHRRALDGETVISGEDSFESADGNKHWARRMLRPWLTGNGAIGGIVILAEHTTQRKQAEERLHLAASVFTHASEGITITDADGNILDVNDAFTRITGYSREEVLGKTPRILNSGRQSREFYTDMWNQLLAKGHWSGEIWNRAKDGHVFAEMLTISAVPDATGKTQQYVAMFSDITSIKEQERQLEHIAHYDLLTGLPNRVLLVDRLNQAVAQAHRRGGPVAIVCLDLDNFKPLNDRHGHNTGDELLTAVTTRMSLTLREGDTLGRLGGDEFVAVMDIGSIEESAPLIEALLDAVAEPIVVGELELRVSASAGVAFFPQTEDVDADQLLRQADQAMYRAKLEGKNRYHIFDPHEDRSVRGHHEDIERIRHALEAQEFVLYYQPKVNMSTGEVLGVEGLIRWMHPEAGLLPPVQFLPVIEGHPIAVELGEWVIDSALAEMERWRAEGLEIPVSVNIAAQQLQKVGFVERLSALLAAHPSIPPSRLELEVLESSALEDVALVSQVIRDCKKLGVSFALDDFGTGYSSLSYLKRLPVDVLKIDQSFVHDMLDDPEDLTILEGVLGLATAFRRRAIAEGVETVEHGEMLLRLGCQLAQGYVIARPMPARNLPAWAAAWSSFPQWTNVAAVEPVDWPLLYASVEHRAWFVAIEDYLTGHRHTPPVLDHRQCRFGGWLFAQAALGLGGRPGFKDIDVLHHQVHALAAEILALKADGHGPAALVALGELHGMRDTLLERLNRLVQSL
jgi:diguanylate cyclase (GGDEF)-like protein/PAS domain S-box-containing protein